MPTRPRNPSNGGLPARRLSGAHEYYENAVTFQDVPSPKSTSSSFIRRLTSFKPSPASPDGFPGPASRRSSLNQFADGPGHHGLICVHSPADPLVDLIFVHGLHGGSYKTWRKKEEQGYFWPGEWLPQDPDFRYVRIHTFGYAAEWSDFKAKKLSINDFGNSLRGSMIGSPLLTRGEKTPIILVGHSMGGLVIKKACLLFQQAETAGEDPHDANLAKRVRCLMFLGTPHHGSDSADRLDKILRATGNSTSYVAELKRGSPSNQAINDEFRFIAKNYNLYSFYETKDMPGLGSVVVDQDSACIGGPQHEIVEMMEADHRSICKYDHPDDASYRTIRNHLSTVIDDLTGNEDDSSLEEVEPLEVYLDCKEVQDDTLETILEPRVAGSCQWIEKRKDFVDWKTGHERGIRLYWLHGPPGTGKSVMSANLANSLQAQHVSHFFFINGNKYHHSVASMLRLVAFQMSKIHPSVDSAIRDKQQLGVRLDEADEKSIWKHLFVGCILKMPLASPQYWIIDGLDECKDFAKLFPLLTAAHPSFPLRIFLTSRTTGEIRNHIQRLSGPNFKVTSNSVTPEDTEADIELLLRNNQRSIPVDSGEERAGMVKKIVSKSNGSFLWTKTILKEMDSVFSKEERERLLEDVPRDMIPHYHTIVDHMSAEHHRQKRLIHTILTWAVCGARPLTTPELQVAVNLDTGEELTGTMQRTIETLCGQLLIINKHDAVQLVHSTAREFLVDKQVSSEYSIRREEGNARLAKACLKYLSGDDLRPKGRLLTGLKSKQTIVKRVSPFADYASTAFSLHLVRGPADSDEIFELLVKFLRSNNVLCWIEYVADKFRTLEHIKEAGANIRRFLERRSKYFAPFGPDFSTAKQWSIDLLRIVSKFGKHILDSPSQLHMLVPAICPRTSAVHQQFRHRNADLQVVGLSDNIWADAISYIEHIDEKPSSVACGAYYVAIGKDTGVVRLFGTETCEEVAILHHDESVTAMEFDDSGDHLITSGRATIKYWDLTDVTEPEEIWSKEIRQPCLGFYFATEDDTLLATTRDNCILSLALDPENDRADIEVPLTFGKSLPPKHRAELSPTCPSFSPDGTMVAFAYRDRSICLWNLGDVAEDEGTLPSQCGRKADVEVVMFNPNPDLRYLVVTYKQGELALINYDSLIEERSVPAEPYALASTPDGRTLATGDRQGSIQLWDFETLTLLYYIKYHSCSVNALIFSRDGLRLFDTRETHSVVWEPAALIRNTDEEENTSTSGTSVAFSAPFVPDYEDPVDISALTCHPSEEQAFVGKEDGTVSVYDLATGSREDDLFTLTPDKPVSHIAVGSTGVLACADATGKILVTFTGCPQGPETAGSVLKIHSYLDGDRIQQLLFSASEKQLLIAGTKQCQVWQLDTEYDKPIHLSSFDSPQTDCWRFFPCPEDPGKFQLIDKKVSDFIAAEAPQLKRIKKTYSSRDGKIHAPPAPKLRIRNAVVDPVTGYLVVEYEGAKATTQLLILEKTPAIADSNSLSPLGEGGPPPSAAAAQATQSPTTTDCYRLLLHLGSSHIRMFLGLHKGRVVYLGSHLWIRTVDLRHLTRGAKSLRRRHFFIPHEYIGGNHQVQAVVGHNGQVVFPRRGELAVVLGGNVFFPKQGVELLGKEDD